jgi:hypothetical protein
VSDKLGKMYKETIVAYFKASSHLLTRGTKENHESFSQDRRRRDRESNPVKPSMKQEC